MNFDVENDKKETERMIIQLEAVESQAVGIWNELRDLWQSITQIPKSEQGIIHFEQFLLGHEEGTKSTNKDWYNAGIMAQLILQNDEIEHLKAKLKQEQQNHYYTRCAWEETSKERDGLKNNVEVLSDRISVLQSALTDTCTCITNESGIVISMCLNHQIR